MSLWLPLNDNNHWAGGISAHTPYLISATYKMLKSDQVAGVFALYDSGEYYD
jgi:hypothetical protein|tara:strand:+ start:142 stop:297 length:156 start_codon:yes stop_codon:yes gene_type:complete